MTAVELAAIEAEHCIECWCHDEQGNTCKTALVAEVRRLQARVRAWEMRAAQHWSDCPLDDARLLGR